jgi:hypothetical protein
VAAWTTDQIIARIRGEADKQKVDPDLAVAVATQESYLDPNARGDNGNSLGLFQLQPAAAIDVGVNPKFRHEPDVNIYGGVSYLKQKLAQSKGNVGEALRRYNGGGDPNYVQNVMRFFKPGVAEASERPQGGTYTDTDVQQALKALQTPQEPTQPQAGTYGDEDVQNALKALQDAPATSPAPPTATSTPEQDAAYRASRSPQAPAMAPQTSPQAIAPPGASQGALAPNPAMERFLALPSIRQLTPADRAGKQRDFAALEPALQEEFLRSEEPASDLTVDIEKTSYTPPRTEADRQTQVQQELAAWEKQAGRPWREGDPRMPSEKRLGVPDEAPVTESLTAPSTMIPLLMPGAGAKAVAPLLTKAPAAVGRLIRPIAEGLSQTLGYGTGRTAETGEVPSAGELGTELAVTTATGGVLEGAGAVYSAFLRRSKGGQAIINADKMTQEAYAKWQADTQAAEDAAKSQQKELYDTAVIKAKASQREYEMLTRQRRETIAANQQDYETALKAQQAEDLAREQARTQKMTQRQDEYTGAIQSQEAALTQARAVPKQYAPETPAWVLYEKYGDAAKDVTLDLAPGRAAVAELRAQRGVLPDGSMRPFPKAVEDIAATLEASTGPVPFETIRQEIRKLGKLTHSGDGNIRGPAKQLMGIYADMLDTMPGTNELLKQANANFRREMAVKDMDEWLQPGHGIVSRDRYNREKIDVAKLFTKVEQTMNEDALFRGSFTPDERQAISAGFGKVAGTPNMPRQPPRDLAPVRPGTPPERRVEPPPVSLPGDVPVKQVPLPATADETRWPTLELPGAPARVTKYEALGPRPRPAAGTLGQIGGLEYLASMVGIPPGVVTAVKTIVPGTQQARWLFAHGLMDARRRQMMQAAINGEGILNPQFYGVMLASLSPAERKAFERETGGVAQRGQEGASAPGGAARQTD